MFHAWDSFVYLVAVRVHAGTSASRQLSATHLCFYVKLLMSAILLTSYSGPSHSAIGVAH